MDGTLWGHKPLQRDSKPSLLLSGIFITEASNRQGPQHSAQRAALLCQQSSALGGGASGDGGGASGD